MNKTTYKRIPAKRLSCLDIMILRIGDIVNETEIDDVRIDRYYVTCVLVFENMDQEIERVTFTFAHADMIEVIA